MEEILLLNKFFFRWRLFGDFLHAVFSASHAQHVSDLHSKFSTVDIHSATAEEKKKEEEETTG